MSRVQVRPETYRRITLIALVALGAIVVTGAAVRLTGSGLGCTDWPTCEDGKLFAEMDDAHAVAEFANRVFTGVVSLAVMLAVLGSLVRVPRRRDLTWLSLGLVGGVIAQIVWGGFTVWSKLAPQFVMGHYLISAVLVADAVVLCQRAAAGGGAVGFVVPSKVVAWSRAVVALGVAVIVTGTIVTNTGPHSGDVNSKRFGFDIAEVARIHGVLVLTLLAVVLVTLRFAYRSGAPETVRRRGGWLVGAIVVQGAIGYTQYFTGVPALLVGFHVLGSVLVWVAILWFHLGLAVRPPLERRSLSTPSTKAMAT